MAGKRIDGNETTVDREIVFSRGFDIPRPDGTDHPNKSMLKEVVQRERLRFSLNGERGGPAEQFEIVATFEDNGDQTRFTMPMVAAEARDENVREYGSIEGGKQKLDGWRGTCLCSIPQNHKEEFDEHSDGVFNSNGTA